MGDCAKYIRESLREKFEFQNYGHALEILSEAFADEWNEIQDCLEQLSISTDDLKASGGMRRQYQKNLTMYYIL